jgi:uncharacterized membrane protein YgcG
MIKETVGVDVSANAAQARAEFARLKGEVGKLRGELDKVKEPSALDNMTKTLVAVNQGLGIASRAVAMFKTAWNFAKEGADVQQFARNVDQALIGRVQTALNGVVNTMALMTEANKNAIAGLSLTEKQFTQVYLAAEELGDNGFGETTDIAERMFAALRKGTTRELKEFNIHIKEGLTGQEKMTAVLGELEKIVARSGGTIENTADRLARAEAQWTDFWNNTKIYAAEAASAMWDFVNAGAAAANMAAAANGQRVGMMLVDDVITPNQRFTAPRERARLQGMPFPGGPYRLDDPASPLLTPMQQYERDVEEARRKAGLPRSTGAPEFNNASWNRTRWGGYYTNKQSTLAGPGDPTYYNSAQGFSTIGSGLGGVSGYSSFGMQASSLGGEGSALGRGDGGRLSGAGRGWWQQEMDTFVSQRDEAHKAGTDLLTTGLEAFLQAENGKLKAAKRRIAEELRSEAASWAIKGAVMAFSNPLAGGALIAGAAAAYALAGKLGGESGGGGGGGAPMGIPGGGYARAGGGSSGAPAPVNIYIMGSTSGAAAAVSAQEGLAMAKRQGLLPTGGPSTRKS